MLLFNSVDNLTCVCNLNNWMYTKISITWTSTYEQFQFKKWLDT